MRLFLILFICRVGAFVSVVWWGMLRLAEMGGFETLSLKLSLKFSSIDRVFWVCSCNR